MSPEAEAADIAGLVRKSGTSFYWAMRFMPAERRNAMFAIYAFCRVVDDIADDAGSELEKRSALNGWRGEIQEAFEGRPATPIGMALAEAAKRYPLARRDLAHVIDGMEMDSADRLRIDDLAELFVYCDRVACAVGRLSVAVFGETGPMGLRLARTLGDALQLTNILRDIDEDAGRDRVYIPKSMLSRAGIGDDDASAIAGHPNLPAVLEEISRLAASRYREAEFALRHCDAGRVRAAKIMMRVYRRSFERLRQRGWSPPRAPVRLSKLEKLGIAVASYL